LKRSLVDTSLQCKQTFNLQKTSKQLMRKVFLTVAAVIAIASASFAQKGKNQIGIGAEVGIGTQSGQGTAFGGTVKYLHGIGTSGQITLTSGALFHSESVTDPDDDTKFTATARYIPVLLGYRHNFNGLYVEPQLGYMSTGVTFKLFGQKESLSSGSFAYGIGGGYAFNNGLDLGVSFRNTAESEATGMIAFRVGYNFSLGGSK
jgi:hypothetical protein